MDKLRIGYFADGPWAHLAFEKLINDSSIEIAFICVRYDRNDEILKEYANKYAIDLLSHKNINSDEFFQIYEKYKVDLNVSMSFNQIFKKRMITAPPMETINCHAGKLPYYRGRNILNWALINDAKEFGITVHYMDEGIDTGDIILQNVYPIDDTDTYQTLLERAYVGCAETLYKAIKDLQAGTAKRVKQSSIAEVGMYCGMRQVGDEILDWNQSSRDIFNFVRAICKPGPMAQCKCKDVLVEINRVSEIKGAPVYKGIPGQIIGKEGDCLLVKTRDSFIRIEEYYCDSKLRIGDRLYG